MDLKKVFTLPPSEQLRHLENAIVDYRCKTDPLMQGESEQPWVTATITAIEPEGSEPSIFLEGRWLFLKHVELRPNAGQHLRRQVPKYGFDDRRDGSNSASDELKSHYRKIIPGPVSGAAGPQEFART